MIKMSILRDDDNGLNEQFDVIIHNLSQNRDIKIIFLTVQYLHLL